MHISLKRLVVTGAAGALAVGVLATPALASDDKGVSQGISGGTLTEASAGLTFTGKTLTGSTVASDASTSAWSVVNAKGTDTAWTVSVTSTDLTSAAGTGTGETDARTIPATQLSFASNSVAPGTDADAGTFSVGDATDLIGLSTGNTPVLTASTAKGSYTYTPKVEISIKANQYRANWVDGTDHLLGANPYLGTLTMTVA